MAHPSDYSCFICNQSFNDDSTASTVERWKKVDANRRAHTRCFKCTMCDAQISAKYHEKKDGSFYCVDNGCVSKLYGDDAKIVSWNDTQKDEYCFICQSQLDGAYITDSDCNKYHKNCFKCKVCMVQLTNSFVRENTSLWCTKCSDSQFKDTSSNIPDNVEILKSSAMDQLFYMIRNKDTSHADYVFYSNRLCRMLAEEGLARINDNKAEEIQTPCGRWTGIKPLDAKQLCVVSIVRSGDILCEALLSICRGISVGKILVQRDENSKDKHCVHYYTKLPKHISSLKVLLVDPMLGTGGSSCAVTQILIENGVKEENILFLNILGCSEGLWVLKKAYPNLRVLTCGIEPYMNENKYLVPGIGDFGDRYYNTQ